MFLIFTIHLTGSPPMTAGPSFRAISSTRLYAPVSLPTLLPTSVSFPTRADTRVPLLPTLLFLSAGPLLQRSFLSAGALMWNALLPVIRTLSSLREFRCGLFRYLQQRSVD